MRRALVTLGAAVAMLGAMMESASAQESVRLHAAGSLRSALSEIAERYEALTQTKIVAVFGASGLLRDRLAGGETGDSEHPRTHRSWR